jgi:tetratricopeptide (TPR) repeat protein
MTSSDTPTAHRVFLILQAGLLTLLWLAPSRAEARKPGSKAAYEKHMAAARKSYAEKEYEKAIEGFEKAFAAHPDPKIHFNLAQSHRLLGHEAQALEHYRKFLAAIPGIEEFTSEKKEAMTAEVEKRIAALEESLRPASEPDPAPDPESRPEPDPVPVAPAGEVPLLKRWWFWTGVGVTAALTLGTVWAGTRALSANDDWERDQVISDRDRAARYQDMTDVFLAGAVVTAAGVGIVSWMVLRKQRSRVRGSATTVTLVPGCGAQGCGLTLSWHF